MAENARVGDAWCERAQSEHFVRAITYAAHDHVDPGVVLARHRFADFGHRCLARPRHQKYFQPYVLPIVSRPNVVGLMLSA